jgi:hypothetical protein
VLSKCECRSPERKEAGRGRPATTRAPFLAPTETRNQATIVLLPLCRRLPHTRKTIASHLRPCSNQETGATMRAEKNRPCFPPRKPAPRWRPKRKPGRSETHGSNGTPPAGLTAYASRPALRREDVGHGETGMPRPSPRALVASRGQGTTAGTRTRVNYTERNLGRAGRGAAEV